MKALVGLLSLITAALTAAVIHQRQQTLSLRQANVALQEQLAEMSERPAVPAAPAVKLSDDLLNELLRLRAEVARRPRELPRPQSGKVAQLEATVAQQADQLAAQAAEQEFQHQIASRVEALKTLGLAARSFAVANGDRLPATLEEMSNEMGLDTNGRLPGGLSPDEFEFYPQPRPVTEHEPNLILFREKRPLVHPTAGETRVFCLADGSVQKVSGARLAEFERAGTATGQPPGGGLVPVTEPAP